MFLWYISVTIYLLLWAALLIHCIKRRAFYPILGTGWGTKALWLTTFFLFSPPLTILYIIFGVLIKPKGYHNELKLVRPVSVVILLLLTFIIVTLEMPAWKQDAKPKVFSKGTVENKPFMFITEINAGILNAKNNFSTSTNTAHRDHHLLAARTILLETQGSDELLNRVAENLAKSLSGLSYISKVEYYPEGSENPKGLRAPDVHIYLEMPKKKHTLSPVGRKLNAVFNMQALSKPLSNVYHGDLMSPRLSFAMKTTLDHRSTFTGYQSSKAKYKQQSENIASQFYDAIEKQFKQWIDKYGLMGELPDIFYGDYHEPPEFEFLKDKNPRILTSDYGVIRNNYTQWSFVDNRPAQDVLLEIWQYLHDTGWEGKDTLIRQEKERFKNLRMDKDSESIYIVRKKKNNPGSGRYLVIDEDSQKIKFDMPFIVHYENRFNNDQFAKLKQYLIESNTDVQTLLMFNRLFERDKKEAFAKKLEQIKGLDFGAHFELAKYYQQNNEIEKAKNALLYARALTYTLREHTPKRQAIKKLAKKLGDEKLADLPIGDEIFQKIGLIDANSLDEPYEVEKNVGEAFSIYYVKRDGAIKTCTLRVFKDANGQYTCQKVEKDRSSTSYSSRSMSPVKNNGRQIMAGLTGENFRLENASVLININVTDDGKILYKAKKN
jgi:hypothetical protein